MSNLLNNRTRHQLLTFLNVQPHMETFLSEEDVQKFPKEFQTALKSANTQMKKAIKLLWEALDSDEKGSFKHDAEHYRVHLDYIGKESITTKKTIVLGLLERVMEHECRGCYKTASEVYACQFRKDYKHLMTETKKEDRSNSCGYSSKAPF